MSEKAFFQQLKIVYIEVTNKCNIQCKYCYEVQKSQARQMFTEDLFRRIIDKVALYSEQQQISVIFHGGEPLLAPVSFFASCMAYAQRTLEEAGKRVDFGLQSNLLLLKPDLIPVLKQYEVGISTSIDGPAVLHDEARGGWQLTMEHMRQLREAGVRVNFISVCSQHNKNHIADLFRMAKELHFKNLQLNIASSVQRINPASPYEPMTEDEIYDVYMQSLAAWRETGVQEKSLALIIKRFLLPEFDIRHALWCESPYCYAGTSMWVFTPDGKMHMCSPAVPLASELPDIVGGHIDALDETHRVEALRAFHAKDEKYYTECQQCEASRICSFGCPAFNRIDPVTAENRCRATKRLYTYLGQQDQAFLHSLIATHEPDTNR